MPVRIPAVSTRHLSAAMALLLGLTWLLSVRGDEPAKVPGKAAGQGIDFARQIRPLLSENCFHCHGPDEKDRKAKLRLDTRGGLFGELRSGGRAVVPGKPAESVLLERLCTEEPSERMPPPKTGKKLSKEQIEQVRRWIAEGAHWAEHWAFVPPQRPALPAVKNKTWPRNPIDYFILARLEKEGLQPAQEADRERLIRRVTLDLIGLPPTPQEIDDFVNDKSPDAYEKVVERLLQSPHHGERLALDWLDAARYADTHGYHIDSGRDMTRWREYVINAFHTNKPYDRFIVEQMAGDLLPNATLEQKVASGFNRNHMINFEGGAIPAEYHNAYIVDRVNTTTTVFLGVTFACAQCHDHKYDPFSQKDYYRLYAFFHNVPENGLDGSKGNAAPVLRAPSMAQERELARAKEELAKLEEQLRANRAAVDAAQAEWEKTALADQPVRWHLLKPSEYQSRGGARMVLRPDGSIFVTGHNPATDTYTVTAPLPLAKVTGVKLEALPDPSLTAGGPGRSINGNIVLTNVGLKAEKPLKIASAVASFSQKDFPITNILDGNPRSGWAIHPEVGKAQSAVLVLGQPLTGENHRLTTTLEFNSQFGQHTLGRFRLSVTDADNPASLQGLPPDVQGILAVAPEKRTAKQKESLQAYYRNNVSPALRALQAQIADLRNHLATLEKNIPTTMVMQEMPQPRETFILLRGEYDKKGEKVTAGTPTALPLLRKDAPLNRLGLAEWMVSPTNPLTGRVQINRYWQLFFGTGLVKTAEDFGAQGEPPSHPQLLDWLAVELTNPSPTPPRSGEGPKAAPSPTPPRSGEGPQSLSPLSPRGRGVGGEGDTRSPADSTTSTPPSLSGKGGGGLGSSPSWDLRHLIRLIVTSATYRQSSVVTPAQLQRDPENRLLARGPRFRLQAEFIRDQALAVSGLLDRRIGGASVFPYQPAGLWQELASRGDSKNWSAQFYTPSKGRDLYRRTMYTFWKRTSPPPSLATFDAPDREICVVRRARTNTPLQALVLMNDPTYVEASRHLAERLLREAKTTENRLTLAFRLTTARQPNQRELMVLTKLLQGQLDIYRRDEKAALKLLSVGESPRDERLSASEVAAWTMVSSAILNLDEVLTRN